MEIILLVIVFAISLLLFWLIRGNDNQDETSQPRRRRKTDTIEQNEANNTYTDSSLSNIENQTGIIPKSIPGELKGDNNQDINRYNNPDRKNNIKKANLNPSDLPYKAIEIVDNKPNLFLFLKTLENAELFAYRKDIATAVSLYIGVKQKISDQEAIKKINANIDYLAKPEEEYDDKAENNYNNASQNRGRSEAEIAATERANSRNAESMTELLKEISNRMKLEDAYKRQRELDFNNYQGEIKKMQEKIENLQGNIISQQPSSSSDLDRQFAQLQEQMNKIDRALDIEPLDLAPELKNNNEQIANLRSELNNITSHLNNLLAAKEREEDQYNKKLKDLENLIQKKEDDNKNHSLQIEQLKDLIKELNTAPKEISVKAAMPETPMQFTIDTKPLVELFDKFKQTSDIINQQKAETGMPASGGNNFQNITGGGASGGTKSGPNQRGENKAPDSTSFEKKVVTNENQEPDDWELVSDIEHPKSAVDKLTDEDIFEQILQEAAVEQKKDFSIIGDHEPKTDDTYAINDPDLKRKQESDQEFYEKFLQHQRRKTKELPILKVSYDFNKLPDQFSLSRDKNILEYSFYKYKPMLQKANDYMKHRKVRDAINYYKVILEQNIPPEFKKMIRANIQDLTDYLEKYLSSDD